MVKRRRRRRERRRRRNERETKGKLGIYMELWPAPPNEFKRVATMPVQLEVLKF